MKTVIRLLPLLLVVALLLAGCGGAAETAAPSGGSSSGGASGSGASSGGGGDSTGALVINQDSAAQTVEMKLGEKATLKLPDGFKWEVVVTPDMVVGTVADAQLQAGETAILEAKMVGNAVIQATGQAKCVSDNPPCATPQAQFNIKVHVSSQ